MTLTAATTETRACPKCGGGMHADAPTGVICRACVPVPERAWRMRERCCEQAHTRIGCVCEVQTWCPTHGTRCHGSHD